MLTIIATCFGFSLNLSSCQTITKYESVAAKTCLFVCVLYFRLTSKHNLVVRQAFLVPKMKLLLEYKLVISSLIATLTLCSPLTSQLHTTTASTTRQTPHAVIENIVLLMMGIMMPETCWGSINHEINFRLQWHLVGFILTWSNDARSL